MLTTLTKRAHNTICDTFANVVDTKHPPYGSLNDENVEMEGHGHRLKTPKYFRYRNIPANRKYVRLMVACGFSLIYVGGYER